MLTTCKECGMPISDKAYQCPHCGYPLQPDKIRASTRKKRLPNGFGQISKLNNPNLRKPYRVMVTVGKTEFGKPVQKILKPNGYFESYKQAYEALLDHAKNPYNINKEMTLKELFDEWSKDAFKDIGYSMQQQYLSAWRKCEQYYNTKVKDIKPKHIKEIVCQPNISDAYSNLIKTLFNNMFDYATENEISEKNYARITKIKRGDEYYQVKKGHKAFTNTEFKNIMKHSNDSYMIQSILIQCFTGLRPNELLDIRIDNINFKERYIIGGMKTKAGKNRKIPIHDFIYPIIDARATQRYLVEKNGHKVDYKYYRLDFMKELENLNIKDHTPHDPRKFFITKCKEAGMDEYAIKKIVGHEISDITEKVYTERSYDWLRTEFNKLDVGVMYE